MTSPPLEFHPGSLYIAGFAQASKSPHVGLLIPIGSKSGCLVHIRIDRETSENWQYQCRTQRIEGEMMLTSLLKIHDVADGLIGIEKLQAVAKAVPAPENDTFGECSAWVYKVVESLDKMDLVKVEDIQALESEFQAFAEGNHSYARRDRFPNVSVSKFCV